jgi:hypothetical protein
VPSDTYAALTPHLNPGERLLWFGRPKQGLLLRGEDAWLIPFSLVWCFFSFPGSFSRLVSGGGGFIFFDLLFAIVGLYLLIGRFLVDMWLRAHTYYGLTERQALILTGGFSEQIRFIHLKTLGDLKLTMRRDGTGTIELGKPKFSIFGPRASRAFPSPGTGQYLPPAFEAIPDARRVYDLIVQAQHQAQHRL